MVSAGIVLVDASLDETEPQDTGVEVEVFLRRPRDAGDVMNPADGFRHGLTVVPADHAVKQDGIKMCEGIGSALDFTA